MAVVVISLTVSDMSIGDLNSKCQFPTKVDESLEGCKALLSALQAGVHNCSAQVTVRDTAPSITTSGSGSTQNSYTK